jgi:hypothetical protein
MMGTLVRKIPSKMGEADEIRHVEPGGTRRPLGFADPVKAMWCHAHRSMPKRHRISRPIVNPHLRYTPRGTPVIDGSAAELSGIVHHILPYLIMPVG